MTHFALQYPRIQGLLVLVLLLLRLILPIVVVPPLLLLPTLEPILDISNLTRFFSD
jgi:hypothetical protein